MFIENTNQLLVVLVGLLLKDVELLLKSTDTACCGDIWNQRHLVVDAWRWFITVAISG